MVQQQEPPSCRTNNSATFFIGRDREGHCVVQDQQHLRGGWFVDRDKALRFLRMENGGRLPEIVTVQGILELDMAGAASTAARRPG